MEAFNIGKMIDDMNKEAMTLEDDAAKLAADAEQLAGRATQLREQIETLADILHVGPDGKMPVPQAAKDVIPTPEMLNAWKAAVR